MKKILNKLMEIVNKNDSICVFIYFIFILSIYVYGVNLVIGDELWNYSFIYKMSKGFQIYKDLNVIITPLFHYIGKITLNHPH